MWKMVAKVQNFTEPAVKSGNQVYVFHFPPPRLFQKRDYLHFTLGVAVRQQSNTLQGLEKVVVA